MEDSIWKNRCDHLTKIRNSLQKENRKLMSAIAKISYFIKRLDQDEMETKLRKFYLYLEKRKWVKVRNTKKVIQGYKKYKADKEDSL